MKNLLPFLFSVTFFFWYGACAKNCQMEIQFAASEIVNVYGGDTLEIQKLIRQVVDWGESTEAIDVFPVLVNECVYRFDKNKLKENLDRLRGTTFFSKEFIENYNRLILTLDGKLANKEFDGWAVGDLPPFKFGNDASPWCMCQGFSALEFEGVKVIKMDSKSGELIWKWKEGSNWIDFNFRVINENNRWRVFYIQGFDHKEGVKEAGEI